MILSNMKLRNVSAATDHATSLSQGYSLEHVVTLLEHFKSVIEDASDWTAAHLETEVFASTAVSLAVACDAYETSQGVG